MDAISIIKSKKENIASKANIKELVFYKFLTNDIVEQNSQGLGDIEKACVLVFTNSQSPTLPSEIQRIRNSSPIRGFHYSYELISLCAVALSSDDDDIQSLKAYFNSHGLVDKYILSKLFPNHFSLVETEGGLTSIELLIKEVFIIKNHQIDTTILYNAIESAENLIDIFVIENALKELFKFHPDARLKENFDALKFELSNFKSINTRRVNITLNVFIILFIFGFVAVISYLAYDNWNVLEPITFVGSLILASLGFIYLLLFHRNIDYKGWTDKVKKSCIRKISKFLAIDFDKINNILNE